MPTLALSNSITFAHINDQENDFPKIRVGGDYGWIAAIWGFFPMIWLQTDLQFQSMPPFIVGVEVPDVTSRLADALKFSGLISLCYGAFCFLLPNTPQKKDAVEKLAFKKAFELFQYSFFTILVLLVLPLVLYTKYTFCKLDLFFPALVFQIAK
ncbi:hypothetical protein Ct9H90mP29_07240 [bacterium]|nr:MAG: hypothetical protein Ct9H90mP29_07240 [bacterium]